MFNSRLQDAAGNPFHGHSGTKAFPSFTASEAKPTPEGLLVWQITRAEGQAAVIISPAETRVGLAVKDQELADLGGNQIVVPAGDHRPILEFSRTYEELCSRMLDYSELKSLQFQ